MDISVIVPFYKGNAYMDRLFACIRENAACAPSVQIELLLVNDSPDCPIAYDPTWVQGFCLNILVNAQNSGIHRSRVNGLKEAKGTYVVMLDQDDLLEPYGLKSQFDAIGNADLVLANGCNENQNRPVYLTERQQQHAASERYYYTVSNQIASPGQCMIKRSAIPEAWYDSCISRNGSDDLLLWLMLFHNKASWVCNYQRIYTHKDTGSNLSNDVSQMVVSSFEALDILKSIGWITAKQERQFRRSRMMAQRYIGAAGHQKLLVALRYPDIMLYRLKLHLHSK